MISHIHPIPAFSDNYIWALHCDEGNSACVVDPGDAVPVIAYLEQHGLNLTDILITHHHPDHIGGLATLANDYAPRIYGPGSSGIKGINQVLGDGDRLTVFGEAFAVIEVPGHTMDHIAYYCADSSFGSPLLFCGDTLFAAGCGRLFEGTPAIMHQSLGRLAALPAHTAVYCTHEYTMANLKFAAAADPNNASLQSRISDEQSKRDQGRPTLPSSIGLELATNPFLRCNETALAESAASRLGRDPASEVEVFATIRQWKDNF